MKPIIDHIQITVKDINLAESFYDKLIIIPALVTDPSF